MKDDAIYELIDAIKDSSEDIVEVDVTPDFLQDNGILSAFDVEVKKGKAAASESEDVTVEDSNSYKFAVVNNALTNGDSTLSKAFGIDEKFTNPEYYQA